MFDFTERSRGFARIVRMTLLKKSHELHEFSQILVEQKSVESA